MNKKNSRAIAATILAEIRNGNGSLSSKLHLHQELADYSLLQEICYGCSRWFESLEFLLSKLVTKPMKPKDADLHCLLIVGLYQLRELSKPDYAVINETVSATVALGKPWSKSLTNAVLRNYCRKQEQLNLQLESANESIRYSFPDWLLSQFRSQWPKQLKSIVSNSNNRPPMTLRVNHLEKSRDDVLAAFAEAGIDAIPGKLAETSIYLNTATAVHELPGFEQGWMSVQDESSQLVAGLLQLEPGQRVLDACAAPGGKTCHILESEHSLTSVLALDIAEARLSRLTENLDRLGLSATLLVADAANPKQWWDGEQFDRILLDAPCSATGIIRRHPDIKLLRTAKEVDALLQTQSTLLQALWACLKPGGLLLYTTCSILQQENQGTIAHFLETTDNAKYEGIAADWGVECSNGRQLLPGDSTGPDGFFYSLLRKIQAPTDRRKIE